MARRWLAVVFLTILAGALVRQIQVENDSRYGGQRGPYLQNLTPHSVVVRWQTEQPGPTRLTLDGITVARQQPPATEHRLALNHLRPNHSYRYRVEGIDSAESTFTTPPPLDDQNTPQRLWILGDPGEESLLHQQSRQAGQQWLREQQRPGRPLVDIWLTNGDNAYTSGRNSEFQQAIFEPYQDWLGRYALVPVIGNHDLRRRAFPRLFDFPQAGEQGGVASGTWHYFAITQGAVHIVVLDSEWSLVHEREAMLEWLEADLSSATRPWRIAVLHHPPYSKGSHDSDDAWGSDRRLGLTRRHIVPVLERHNVDLVINGHSHAYERSHLLDGHYGDADSFSTDMQIQTGSGSGDRFTKNPDCEQHCGTVYQVMGSTAELVGGPLDHPAMAVGLELGGTLVVDAGPDCLVSRFISNTGQIADQFLIGRGDAVCKL